ncbi:PilN domain-containing protein [Ferrimonas balearica]|uniref:PilN domain-containing protein n=1 Tax=Ferrimonas balearica TaxID=44012 RepID=UPI001C9A08DC|nr:PilN domain-containing protein [Ferrimonas balearica]MBY5992091.1 PilN domain-containing protein [Ferrimonas balearica]
MAHINLLPWREAQRLRRKKEYLYALGAVAVLSLAVTLVANLWVGHRQDLQRERNQYLQTEIAKLDIQIAEISKIKDQKANLMRRIDVIEALQMRRHLPVQVMNELARVMVPGVYLTRLKVENGVVQVEGYCESNNHLANMMREVEQAKWLAQPKVQQIVAANGAQGQPGRVHAFKLELAVLQQGDGPLRFVEELAAVGGQG